MPRQEDGSRVSHASATDACDISVVIPTRNRPQRIMACLAALAAQTYDHDRFEVIVVDDGSDASLAPTVVPFRERMRLELIEQSNAGPARARNVGAARAAGALLAFTDDDCEPQEDWLAALRAHSQARPDCAIGGHTVNALPKNACSTASQLLVDYLYEYHSRAHSRDPDRAPAAPPFFTSNNLAVPASVFRDIGGFDESFPLAAGEDREFCDRWQQRGYHLFHARDAVVRHAHALSLARFWRQHVNYGRGACCLRRARAERGMPAPGIEPLSFYWRLMTYPVRADRSRSALLLVPLMFVSQVANTLGFALERHERG